MPSIDEIDEFTRIATTGTKCYKVVGFDGKRCVSSFAIKNLLLEYEYGKVVRGIQGSPIFVCRTIKAAKQYIEKVNRRHETKILVCMYDNKYPIQSMADPCSVIDSPEIIPEFWNMKNMSINSKGHFVPDKLIRNFVCTVNLMGGCLLVDAVAVLCEYKPKSRKNDQE